MPSKTHGKRNPTPGVVEESIRPPMVAPTQNSETDVSVLEAEYDGVFQPQSVTDFNDHEDEQGDGPRNFDCHAFNFSNQQICSDPIAPSKIKFVYFCPIPSFP